MPQSPSQALPDTSDDHCQVCGQTAPFLERELATGIVQRFCRMHIPADWPMPKSLARLMEETYMSLKRQNESSPPVVSG